MLFWIGVLVVAAALSGVLSVLLRKANKAADPLSLAVYFNVFTALAYVPLLLLETPTIPAAQWPLVIASALVWFAINAITFYAYKQMDITLMHPIKKMSVLFVTALSVLVLGEALSTGLAAGTVLLFIGLVALSWNRERWSKAAWQGVGLTLVSTVLVSVAVLIDKINITAGVSPALYGLLLYLVPGIAFGVISLTRRKLLVKTTRSHLRELVALGAISAVYYWLNLTAYKVVALSVAYPILQLSVIFSMIIAYYWLHEKQDFRNRMIGAATIIAGAILVTLAA
jgi:drug/metabolite transporter (DMT)-like permease